MKTVTIKRDDTAVTITQGNEMDASTACDMVEMLHDALLGLGYHPENVAEAMVEVGDSFLPKEEK